jgi:hypothetical protein
MDGIVSKSVLGRGVYWVKARGAPLAGAAAGRQRALQGEGDELGRS